MTTHQQPSSDHVLSVVSPPDTITDIASLLRSAEGHARELHSCLHVRLSQAHELALADLEMKGLERDSRLDVEGRNAQEREDAAAYTLQHLPTFQAVVERQRAARYARDEAEIRAEYHKVMARAITAAMYAQGGAL